MELIPLRVLTGFSRTGEFSHASDISAYTICQSDEANLFHSPSHITPQIYKQFRVDGTPSLGWDNTVAFLAIPVILVISQFVSMQLMQPKSEDPQQQQANAILKFLPLMIGYFSLSVPAALGIYWVTNNFVTTAITLSVRNSLKNAPPPVVTASPSGSGPTVIDAESTVFTPAPMRSKPSGFGESDSASEGMKPITTMDAEIVSEGDDEPIAGSSIPAAPQSKKRGGKKKKKRRN